MLGFVGRSLFAAAAPFLQRQLRVTDAAASELPRPGFAPSLGAASPIGAAQSSGWRWSCRMSIPPNLLLLAGLATRLKGRAVVGARLSPLLAGVIGDDAWTRSGGRLGPALPLLPNAPLAGAMRLRGTRGAEARRA